MLQRSTRPLLLLCPPLFPILNGPIRILVCQNLAGQKAGFLLALIKDKRERMQEYFVQSSRYEYLFWEQAYRQEGWPV